MLPGVLLLSLGAAIFSSGWAAGGWMTAIMGAWVGFGGWALANYSREMSSSKNSFYLGQPVLTELVVFWGAISALSAGALALLSFPGIAGQAMTWAAFVFSIPLLQKLPAWLWNALSAAVEGLFLSVAGVQRVLNSISNDTQLRKRLIRFSGENSQSFGSPFWLPVLWLPILTARLARGALALAAGAALWLPAIPVFFSWGAFSGYIDYFQSQESRERRLKIVRFFASWAHFILDYGADSKIAVFNRWEKPLIPYANSRKLWVSLPVAAAISATQVLWLVYAALATLALSIFGFYPAYKGINDPLGEERLVPHKRVLDFSKDIADKEDLDGDFWISQPSALILAGLPLAFLGRFLLQAGMEGMSWLSTPLYLLASLNLLLVPFMPKGTPFSVRAAPGVLLSLSGLGAVLSSMALGLGVLASPVFWMGSLAMLSGRGLANYARMGFDYRADYYIPDNIYFLAALSLFIGLGVALSGWTGVLPAALWALAAGAGLFFLHEIPVKWLTKGVYHAVSVISGSVRSLHQILDFRDNTKFDKNLHDASRRWLVQSPWNAIWLGLWWVPVAAIHILNFLLTLLGGLAWGSLAAVPAFLYGVAYTADHRSALTRFLRGFVQAMHDYGPISKDGPSDWILARLTSILNRRGARSGLPAARALVGLGLAEILQIARLAFFALGTPLILAQAAIKGRKSAMDPLAFVPPVLTELHGPERIKRGETAVIRGKIRVNEGAQVIPDDLSEWRLIAYNSMNLPPEMSEDDQMDFLRHRASIWNAREFPIHIEASALPQELKPGETLEFSAEIPGDVLLLDNFSERVADGENFFVVGPIAPGQYIPEFTDDEVPSGFMPLRVEESAQQRKLWSKPYPKDQDSHPSDRLHVIFNPDVSLKEARAAVAAQGARINSVGGTPRDSIWMRVRFPPDRTLDQARQRFLEDPSVQDAGPITLR